jgi:competence protein ComEC
VRIGHFISAEAWAYPPLTPVSPGAWDYGRVQWFEGIGGSARLAGPVSVDAAIETGWHVGSRQRASFRHCQPDPPEPA